jgi:chemotaxis protein CheC
LQQEQLNWDHALLVEISYTLEDRCFSCTMFLLMPGESILVVKQALDKLLEDL